MHLYVTGNRLALDLAAFDVLRCDITAYAIGCQASQNLGNPNLAALRSHGNAAKYLLQINVAGNAFAAQIAA
jgi:predicted transposase YbfD/YdcC